MRLRSIALSAITLALATSLSGCASTAGSAVAGAAIGATSAVVKTTVHLTRAAVSAVTPNNSGSGATNSTASSPATDKNEAH